MSCGELAERLIIPTWSNFAYQTFWDSSRVQLGSKLGSRLGRTVKQLEEDSLLVDV